MKKSFYIALEGNIGAGKTSIAKALAARWNARLVLEEFADNPFLEKFYQDKQRYAFPVEMAFLADRYRQLSALHSTEDLFQPALVADYAPFKSLIFAQNNLESTEFALYRNFWEMSLGKQRRPDLVVFLHRPLVELRRNIQKRGRSFEQNLDDGYLQSLTSAYKKFLDWYTNVPYVWIDAAARDYLSDTYAWSELCEQIETHKVMKSQS